jgi:lysine-specific demethylase 8
VAAYYRASLMDDAAEAVRQADLGLMLGDTRHRSQLLELIEVLDPEPDQYAGPAWRTPMPNPCARSVSSSQDILRLSAPSISTFKNECFDVSTPAILEGCIEHWPALRKWSDLGYLDHVAGRRLVPVELGRHYLDDQMNEQLMPLSSFLRNYVQRGDSQAYLAQHALLDQIPRLRRDIASHDYCGCGEGDVVQNAWIGYGTVSPLHRDKSHNLLAQVVGAKYVRLYKPSESSKLYPVAEGVHKDVSSQIDLDAFAPTNPYKRREALRKFPLFESASYIDLILLQGEVLYIPPGWWHYVEALEYSCSVSSWWGRRE